MTANAAKLRGDLGERSRTILALHAAGLPAGRLGGRDLVGEIAREQEGNGSFAGLVNTTAFAVLALRAAGRRAGDPAVRRGATYIAGQANRDGGFNFAGKGGPSGADDTGAALQALAAAGRADSKAARAGARWLARHQNADGGFSLQGGPSNAQSTAWAVQGLVAAGRDPARVRRGGSRSPTRLPALARGAGRRGPLLPHQHPDAGLGHGPGADGARGQGAADRARARRAPGVRRLRAPAATPAPTATPRPTAEPSEPASAPAPVPVAAPAAPRLTPLVAVATALPAATPARARAAGVVAAMATRSLLP